MPTVPAVAERPSLRRLTWPLYVYSLFEELILLYPFYTLFFVASGLSLGQVTALLVLWSAAAIVVEVPSGALADVVPRRLLLAAAPLLAGAGFTLWLLFPSFWVFAAGFALWGAGGALVSGAFEALLYTELRARGAASRYAAVAGTAQACGVVAVGLATVLAVPVMAAGGYAAVGVASVAACALAAAAALALPEGGAPAGPSPHGPGDDAPGDDDPDGGELGFLAALRAGVTEVTRRRAVLWAAGLAAAVPALWEALEEYVPLLAAQQGVSERAVPWVVAAVWAGVAAGGLLAGRAARLAAGRLALLVAAAAAALAAGALGGGAWGWSAVGAAFGVFQAAGVVADARLQESISGPGRATVTSVAGLGAELLTVAAFAGYWAAAELFGHGWAFALWAVPYLAVAAAFAWRSPARA